MEKEKPSDHVPLCPLCEGELCEQQKTQGGWDCACGEFVPKGCHLPPQIEQATSCGALAEIKKNSPQ